MKTKTINLKTIVSLVLLMIAVFGAVNISYSYFTSKASKSGEVNMGSLSVSFCYNLSNTIYDSISLVADTASIDRGEAFGLKTLNEATGNYITINNLQIINGSNSCDAYVRFWIDAYIINDEGEKISDDNYGKYFALTRPNLMPSENNFTRDTKDPYCYFVEKGLKAGIGINLGKELTLKDISETDTVPIIMLGKKLLIKISFDAVQKANKAFESVFAVTEEDPKGYYSGWN